MALLMMKRRWTEENENGVFWILHCDALERIGEKKCYARLLRMDLPPDAQHKLSNGEAGALELDPETLIASPKECR